MIDLRWKALPRHPMSSLFGTSPQPPPSPVSYTTPPLSAIAYSFSPTIALACINSSFIPSGLVTAAHSRVSRSHTSAQFTVRARLLTRHPPNM
ncbi:hypothetical protein V2J09_009055 [Rumex salicifolius]